MLLPREKKILELLYGEKAELTTAELGKDLKKAGEKYNENLIEDESLKYAVFTHLKAMFNRLSHHIHLDGNWLRRRCCPCPV